MDWRQYIPDVPDAIGNPIAWALIAGVLIYLGLRWYRSEIAQAARMPKIARILRWADDEDSHLCLIYYDGELGNDFATAHSETLSTLLARAYPELVAAYDQHWHGTAASFRAHGDLIAKVEVRVKLPRDPEVGEIDGRVKLYPSGGHVSIKAMPDPKDGGAWAWELRNIVRHYHASIDTRGHWEFSDQDGDDAAQLVVNQHRRV